MTEIDKARVLLPHLIEHTRSHGEEFAKWADILRQHGQGEAAELMTRAGRSLQEADHTLAQALAKIGGPLAGHHHDHHSHHHHHE